MSIVIDEKLTTAYSKRSNSYFKLSTPGVATPGAFVNTPGRPTNEQKKAGAASTSPAVSPLLTGSMGSIYVWGANNFYPQEVIRDAWKNTLIPSTLSFKAELLYGGGLGFGYEVEGPGGKPRLQSASAQFPEIARFVESRITQRYIRQASKAYYWQKNIFPEVVLSRDRKHIVSIASQRPEFCRYVKEENTDELKRLAISANWETGSVSYTDKLTTVVDLVDPYDPENIEQLRAGKKFKYVYPVSDANPGTNYYQQAEWHTVRSSGWLKVVEEIPRFKKHLFENQITVKYLIEVSTWWWGWKYPGFDQMPADTRRTLMENELNAFDDFMRGSEAAGSSLMVSFQSDPTRGKEYAGWRIQPIDNKIKDGIYIEDSQEGNSHIMYALGVDPVLRGFMPGAKMASGGSEKRVAWNNHLLITKPHQDDILEALTFIRDFNGWDPNLKFWFKNYYQASLDVAKEPQQQAS